MSEVKAAAPKKAAGNKTTEIIVGTAAMKLGTALTGISAAMTEVAKLGETAQKMTLEVTDLEDKIGGLKQDLENKKSQNKIDLQQAYDSDKKAFVETYCKAEGVILVEDAEYKNLQAELETVTKGMEQKIAQEVGKAVGIEKANSANALKIATLENEKKEAGNTAEITQLKAQNKFLEDQVNHWKTMLDNQMKAETERAKYGAINTLNVGGTTQGR
jgi:hypothetical protein